MNKNNLNHDSCVENIKQLFYAAGFICMNEDQNGKNKKKTPDLKCEDQKIVIEIKTFQGGNKDRAREDKSLASIKSNGAYWMEEKHSTFADRIKSARKKFRNYPGYKSLVVFIDYMPLDNQSIEELLWKESYRIKVFSNMMCSVTTKYADKIFTNKKNIEIGAVALLRNNNFLIIHNHQAKEKRKIPYPIGEKLKATQKIYVDGSIPEIKSIENCPEIWNDKISLRD